MDAGEKPVELVLQRFAPAPELSFVAPRDRFAPPSERLLVLRNPQDFDLTVSVSGGAVRGFIVGGTGVVAVAARSTANLALFWAPDARGTSSRAQLQLRAVGSDEQHTSVVMPFVVTLVGATAPAAPVRGICVYRLDSRRPSLPSRSYSLLKHPAMPQRQVFPRQ